LARINIENSLFTDKRWTRLVIKLGCEEKAMGALIFAFLTAQKFWFPSRQRIPRKVWEQQGLCDEIIKCGLADENADREIYVHGSEEQFEWLFKNSVGGKKSAQVRKEKYGSAQPKPKKITKKLEVPSKSSEPEPKSSEALTLSLTPTLSHSLSNTGEETPASHGVEVADKKANRTKAFIAAYCTAFENTYKAKPRLQGRDFGVAKRLAELLNEETAAQVIKTYFSMRDAWFLTKSHDLPTLEGNLNKVMIALQTGNALTREQIKNIDKQQTANSQIDRIRRGEL
jgi:hypothetical protein